MDEEDGYLYTMEYYSAIKKNEILPFAATWMDLKGIMLREVRKRKTNTVLNISLVCGNKLMNITKKKHTHRYKEQTCGCQ